MTKRPTKEEYNDYFDTYVRLVPEGDIADLLIKAMDDTLDLFSAVGEDVAGYRYAPGKWSLKEVIGHITDNERIMSYRLLRIARGDRTPLPGYDQDVLMGAAPFDSLPLSDVLEDYAVVRRATLSLLRGLTAEAWDRQGIVSGGELSARALAYIIAGHEIHHLNVVKDKYL